MCNWWCKAEWNEGMGDTGSRWSWYSAVSAAPYSMQQVLECERCQAEHPTTSSTHTPHVPPSAHPLACWSLAGVDQVSAGVYQEGADSDADSGGDSGGAQLLAADPDQVALGTQRVLRGEAGMSQP
jgi:hypothetical protein